ncbi:MAG: efflux RND transporter periplasmic adaptor subunit, partial [Opitutales bacterium]
MNPDLPSAHDSAAPSASSETRGVTPAKIILPILILVGAIGLGRLLVVMLEPEPERAEVEQPVPTVEVITVEKQNVPIAIESQGTVQAETASQLTAEVAGRIIEVSPNFEPGGFFQEGEVLVRIDPADFEAALAQAESSLAQARLSLLEEEARAEQAREDWQRLGQGEASALTLREPQLRRAEAAIDSAEAAVDRARRDLERTTIRAPYDGRVRTQNVDLGERVNLGTPLASIYGTAAAEVRLPLELNELARLDLTERRPGSAGHQTEAPRVVLASNFGGQSYTWEGYLARAEGTIDERTRLAFVVARVDEPYAQDPDQPGRPPLKVGLFVEAIIEGRPLEDVVVIPRYALRGADQVWLATPADTLLRQTVDVIEKDADFAYLR